MDNVEILNLIKRESNEDVDLSFLLSFQRQENGGDLSLLNH
jgi:hypothetical protein